MKLSHVAAVGVAILAGVASITSAAAGSNLCKGIITAAQVPGWTVIQNESTDEDYSFKTNSPLGRRILKVCPIGSTCQIERPLGHSSETVTKIIGDPRRLK
jgi:hypothetical protein